MNWFTGEVAAAITSAVQGKKAFIVFIKGDNDETKQMEELWDRESVKATCNTDQHIAITLDADTVEGKQFASLYPILLVPCTYVINTDGIPEDIVPGVVSEEEFVSRLDGAIKKVVAKAAAKAAVQLNTAEPVPAPEIVSNPEQVEQSSTSQEPSLEGADSGRTQADIDHIKQKIQENNEARAKAEKEKQKEMEYKRRQQGQEISMAKKEMAERQAKQLANELAKSKQDAKAARKKVLDDLARDKAEKAARYEAEKKARLQEKQEKIEQRKQEQAASKPPSDTARIQFRLPTGATTVQVFPATETFQAVSDFAKREAGSTEIRLTMTFPKYEFTQEDMSKNLQELRLTPNASIIVSPGRSRVVTASSSSSGGVWDTVMWVLAPLIMIYTWIASLFVSQPSASPSQQDSTPASRPEHNYARNNSNVRQRNTGNMHTLRQNEDDDDENRTWNGNSTQQM